MTLPAAYPINWQQICAEFSLNPATAVWPRDFYSKGGAPASGNLSFGDFLGRSSGAAFDPMGGTYSDDEISSASFTITSASSVVWTWSRTSGAAGSANVASGSSATSITFSLTAGTTTARQASFSVSAGGQSWTINLTAEAAGSPGTCVTTDSPVLMADGTEKPAGALVVGDMLATYHEDTLEWGAFPIEAISFARDLVFARPGYPNATYRHRFALPRSIARFLPGRARWYRAGWIGRDAGHAMVAKITVTGAHTYMARNPAAGSKWRLSHNVKA